MFRNKIEYIIAKKIRPVLYKHGGDIDLIEVNGRNIKVRLSGACSSCPYIQNTMENIVSTVLKEEIGDEIDRIILWNSVSDDLIGIARNILKK